MNMELLAEVGPGTILLVDDESSIVRAYARLFKGAGYVVLTASNVEEALKLVDQADVIVSDYHMPDGSGDDIVKAARGKPVVIMTASAEEISHKHVLHKPTAWVSLLDTVKLAVMQRAKEMEYVSGVGG